MKLSTIESTDTLANGNCFFFDSKQFLNHQLRARKLNCNFRIQQFLLHVFSGGLRGPVVRRSGGRSSRTCDDKGVLRPSAMFRANNAHNVKGRRGAFIDGNRRKRCIPHTHERGSSNRPECRDGVRQTGPFRRASSSVRPLWP